MKKIISILALFLIAASFLPGYSIVKTYLPLVVKSIATPSPSPTITPTLTPSPGAPPEITYFTCNYISPFLYCFLDVKNVGDRPISDVVIKVYYDLQFARQLNSGPGLIQPGDKYSFSWNDRLWTIPTDVSASIDSWIDH